MINDFGFFDKMGSMKTTIGLIFISILLSSCGDNSRVFEKTKKALKQKSFVPQAVETVPEKPAAESEVLKEDEVVVEKHSDLKITYLTGEMDELPADLLNCSTDMNMSLYHNIDSNYNLTLQNLKLDVEARFGNDHVNYTSTSLRLAPLNIDGREHGIINYQLQNDYSKNYTLGNPLKMVSKDLLEVVVGSYDVRGYGRLKRVTYKTANTSKQIQLLYVANRILKGKITEEKDGSIENDLCIEAASRYQYAGAKCPLKFGKFFLNDCLPEKAAKPSSTGDKQ